MFDPEKYIRGCDKNGQKLKIGDWVIYVGDEPISDLIVGRIKWYAYAVIRIHDTYEITNCCGMFYGYDFERLPDEKVEREQYLMLKRLER